MANTKITSAVIADNAVGISQLNASDGTDGQVLKTNGSGTLSFGDAGGGGGMFTHISTTSVSSEVFSIEFNSLSGYEEYELRLAGVFTGTTGAGLALQFNYGSGYVTADDSYQWKARRFNSSNGNTDGAYGDGYHYIKITYGTADSRKFDTYAISDGSSYQRSGMVGRITFSGTDSRVQSFISQHAGTYDTGIQDMQVTGQAMAANVGLAPTGIRIIPQRGGSAAESASGKGIAAGKFALYGRTSS